jgi:hypothetical protein
MRVPNGGYRNLVIVAEIMLARRLAAVGNVSQCPSFPVTATEVQTNGGAIAAWKQMGTSMFISRPPIAIQRQSVKMPMNSRVF